MVIVLQLKELYDNGNDTEIESFKLAASYVVTNITKQSSSCILQYYYT